MKQLIIIFLSVLFTAPFFGQAPQAFNYQGAARDLSGNPISNQSIGLQIAILKGSANGTEAYKETHNANTTDLGLFNLQIGTGTVVSGDFEEIDWGSESHFLQIEMDENGGSNYQIIGTLQLMSVPYALYAEKTKQIRTGVGLDLIDGELANTGDLDSINEIQYLELAGNNLMISSANSVELPSPKLRVSSFNDTLYIGENYVIIPGISQSNHIIDGDGNLYHSILIGDQIWLSSNLRTTSYLDGTAITYASDTNFWEIQEARYTFSDSASVNDFGLLYNFYIIEQNKNICPDGYKIPSFDDFLELSNFLGGDTISGGKLKSEDSKLWNQPNVNATNEYGFNAEGVGLVGATGHLSFKEQGMWWSSTSYTLQEGAGFALSRQSGLFNQEALVLKEFGAAIRCIKK